MICRKCKIDKQISAFEKTRKTCKTCRNEQKRDTNKLWRKKNPESGSRYGKMYYQTNKGEIRKRNMEWQKKNPDKVLDNTLKSAHGITLQDYRKMLERQAGKCAICNNEERNGKRLSVDHNHLTGKVRGLLCDGCNKSLGLMKDNVGAIKNAVAYLEEHSKQETRC